MDDSAAFQIPKTVSEADLMNIRSLQQSQLRTGNVEDDAKNKRFLATVTDFSILQKLNENRGVIIVKENEKILAYFLVSPLEIVARLSTTKILIEKIREFGFDRPDVCVLMQIYIDSNYRGQNVWEIMFDEVKRRFGEKYAWGVGHIFADNPASIRVFTEKLGGEIVGRYLWNGAEMVLIKESLRPQSFEIK